MPRSKVAKRKAIFKATVAGDKGEARNDESVKQLLVAHERALSEATENSNSSPKNNHKDGNRRASKKIKLEFSSDDDNDDEDKVDEDDEIKLTVNEEYKRRFEHNKEREELDRLKEKEKRGELDSDSDSETSEEEDEDGDLLTNEIDSKIAQVVNALKNNDTTILKNTDIKFFDEIDTTSISEKKDKPVFLKDYHRMNLLGELKEDEEELPYAVQLNRDRNNLVSEIHAAAEGNHDDDDGDGFLLKRAERQREVEPIDLPNPNENPEKFLEEFMESKAWIPSASTTRKSKKPARPGNVSQVEDDHVQPLVDDDSDFDDKAEEFETKYNFRFEAGEEAAQVVTYGRDVVNATSIRREQENPRQRTRRLEREAKDAEKKAREKERARLRQLKIKEVTEKLERIKKMTGEDNIGLTEEDLDKDFSDEEFNRKMEQVFGDEYYSKEAVKPQWDDDIDIDDIVPGFSDEYENESKKISKKDRKKLEKQKKTEKEKTRSKIEEFVDTQILPDAITANVKQPEVQFRYREVSPEAFNLDTVDILLADDKELNEYVGLKKLAPYREREKKRKDHKKYAKKKRLREWRKEVFGSASLPDWEKSVDASKK
ncbi:KRI1-like family C-terminal-domain-containing protein [Lipomyces japonicus]|uniref:KRI1-like family C-terminal-domain-containing protein n=1 Tax=Lipomyces japonicus TaxID=56871 RepID=UPI0034CDDA82